MWEVVLVASIYRREDWLQGRVDVARPEREEMFVHRIKGPNCSGAVARGLADCAAQAERWLKRSGASLVTHVVVTVYSLEVS